MNLFDICIIHAPSPAKAWDFRQLLQKRLDSGLYPREIDFRIYSDPSEGKVGSGGGLISSLFHLMTDFAESDFDSFFKNRKILFINAGGESLNLPCYAPEAKIFTPLPMETSALFSPTILDHHLSLFLKYSWKDGELVMVPADVLIDLDFDGHVGEDGGVRGFSVPVPFEQATQHGVFIFDAQQKIVTDYFQKPDKRTLKKFALLEGTEQAACDTGILSMSPSVISALCNFGLQKSGVKFVWEAFQSGELSLDMYTEVMSGLISNLSYKDFRSRIQKRSTLNEDILQTLFDALKAFSLNGTLYKTPFFHHIRGTQQYIRACCDIAQYAIKPFYETDIGELKIGLKENGLIWNASGCDYYNISSNQVLIEGTTNSKFQNTLGNNIFVGFNNNDLKIEVPQGICLEKKHIHDKTYIVAFSLNDTLTLACRAPKAKICGTPLKQWLEARELTHADIFNDENSLIAEAKIFGPDVTEDFLMGYWNIPDDPEWTHKFKSLARQSIQSLEKLDNAEKRDESRYHIRSEILRNNIENGVGWRNINFDDLSNIFPNSESCNKIIPIAENTDEDVLRSYRTNQLHWLKGATNDVQYTPLSISPALDLFNGNISIDKGHALSAQAPVRLDLSGGWSDTPPWTQSFGGAALNLSVDLYGRPPIQVYLKKIIENKIRFHSVDRACSLSFDCWEHFEKIKVTEHDFSLLAHTLDCCGLRQDLLQSELGDWMKMKGGGFEITTISDVPIGAGVGASSILIAATIRLLSEYFSCPLALDQYVNTTLQIEQQMSISGGWQNPVSGLAGGVKYIFNQPGKEISPTIHYLDDYLFQKAGLRNLFTLYYSGIKRETSSLISEVAQSYYKKQASQSFTIRCLSQVSSKAKAAVEERDIKMLASCLNKTRILSENLHPQIANSDLHNLLEKTNRYWIGVKPMGAGGGGFVLFLSKCENDADKLRDFLYKKSINGNAEIADFSLNTNGIRVY